MSLADPLRQLLYVSQLAPQCDATVVPRIVQTARAHNAACGITGLLVFDGLRFCQLLEGPASQVGPLMARIQQDVRHVDVQTLHTATPAARHFDAFSMGYAAFDDGEPLHALAQHRGEAALRALLALLPRLDMTP
ncbi:MAG: BLUF domain-containing protein [Pseudomonadota bacterium]|nr:BLUF domain-containing protein [Pseudomonadota bacterium]